MRLAVVDSRLTQYSVQLLQHPRLYILVVHRRAQLILRGVFVDSPLRGAAVLVHLPRVLDKIFDGEVRDIVLHEVVDARLLPLRLFIEERAILLFVCSADDVAYRRLQLSHRARVVGEDFGIYSRQLLRPDGVDELLQDLLGQGSLSHLRRALSRHEEQRRYAVDAEGGGHFRLGLRVELGRMAIPNVSKNVLTSPRPQL